MASQIIDLTNETWINGTTDYNTGEFIPDSQAQERIICMKFFDFTSLALKMVVNVIGNFNQYKYGIYFYRGSDFLSGSGWQTEEIDVPESATRFRLFIGRYDGSNISPSEMSSITATINYAQEISVNSWSGFVTALNVSDAVVVLPENAVLDMNDILPYGLTENIKIACKAIYGNGTRIKNLNLNNCYFEYEGTDIKYFRDLLMTDWIGTNKFFDLNRGSEFYRCAISGITSAQYVIANTNSYSYHKCVMISCSVNVEGSHSNFHLTSDVSELKYCRIELHGVNSTQDVPAGTDCNYCELSLYFPNAETGSSGFQLMCYKGCVLHGNMKSVTKCYTISEWSGQPTVFDVDMFADGFVSTKPQYFIPCTDAQLKDPAYLRSKGFPIVVNGGG